MPFDGTNFVAPQPKLAPLKRPNFWSWLNNEPTENETQAIIRRARELLEVHGWRQNSLGGPQYGFCLVGVLSYAKAGKTRSTLPTRLAVPVLSAIRETTGGRQIGIIDYNDCYAHKKAEVIAVLDRAYKLAGRYR